jgi:NAD(P)-dependent dehydrogenase (short-subunit alcohol dehydrogenase family)
MKSFHILSYLHFGYNNRSFGYMNAILAQEICVVIKNKNNFKKTQIMNKSFKRLEGKVAIVTGASKGIGAGIAKEFALEGASVVVNYASDQRGAENTVKEIAGNGGKAIAVHADVSKGEDVKKLFKETKDAFGRLDILVNNAGVFKPIPVEQVSQEEFNRHFSINVLGMLLTTKEALAYFDAMAAILST